MAELNTAFCSSFGSSPCALNFDIVPLYIPGGGDNRYLLGVVSVESGDTLDGYSYSVYPASSTPINPFETFRDGRIAGGHLPGHPLLQSGFGGDNRRPVTKGTLTDTNNMTFTFPIESLEHDYFVLVTPSRPAKETRLPSMKIPGTLLVKEDKEMETTLRSSTKEQKLEFAIFYTSKVLKQRKGRIKSRNAPLPKFVTARPAWLSATKENDVVQVGVSDKVEGEVEAPTPKFEKPTAVLFCESDKGKTAQEWIHPIHSETSRMAGDRRPFTKRYEAMLNGRREDDLKMKARCATSVPEMFRALRLKNTTRDSEETEFIPASSARDVLSFTPEEYYGKSARSLGVTEEDLPQIKQRRVKKM